MLNQRKFIRVQLDTSTACVLLDASGVSMRTIEVTVCDLSAGGALLLASEPLAVGQRVRVAVRCEEPAIDLWALGTIVRAQPRAADNTCRAGVRFASLPEADRVALTRFVLKAARRAGQGAGRILPDASAA